MAKKPQPADAAGEKVRLEVRLDADLVQAVQRLAEEVGISVNQLIQGVTRWAVDNAHVGELEYEQSGWPGTKPQRGCVWFGTEEEVGETQEGEDYVGPGVVAFALDFTERRVIRDDVRRRPTKGRKGVRHE